MLEKLKTIKKSVSHPSVLLIALLILLITATVTPLVAQDSQKQKIVQQVAQKWIQIGTEQFERGMYKAAEQSLLRALDYKEYLSAEENRKIQSLLDKINNADGQREQALAQLNRANELAANGQTPQALVMYQAVSYTHLTLPTN